MTTLTNVFRWRYKGHMSCLCVGVRVCVECVPARYVCIYIYIIIYIIYMLILCLYVCSEQNKIFCLG